MRGIPCLCLSHSLSAYLFSFFFLSLSRGGGGGGAIAQLVERATPGEEVPGSIPAVAARSVLVGSVSV